MERVEQHRTRKVTRTIGKRKGMLYEALERLDALMAIGEKRRQAKARARARGEPTFAFTDQRIHSYQTRATYQDVIMRFLKWCRATYRLNRLDQIDQCAGELSSEYLFQRVQQQYSPWTLQTERSALRLFFGQRDLASEVALPPRKPMQITRSRRPAARDRHLQSAHFQPLIVFCSACGLRRSELRDLRVRDVVTDGGGHLLVHVAHGKGGKERLVPVLASHKEHVQAIVEGRSPDEPVFAHLPVHLDMQALRRNYAQALYQQESGRPLPDSAGPLRRSQVDLEAALHVSQALGHERLDVVLLYYLR